MTVAPAAAAVAVAVTKTVAVRAAVLTVLVIAAPAAKSVGVSFTRNRLSLVSAGGFSLGHLPSLTGLGQAEVYSRRRVRSTLEPVERLGHVEDDEKSLEKGIGDDVEE